MAEANNQGMPKLRSAVWNHFTLITVNKKRKAQCNQCPSRLSATHGTKSLWKHLVNHFTTRIDDQGDRKRIVRCNICPNVFAASNPRLWKHVMVCIEKSKTASVGASEPPPPVQTGAPSGSGAEQGAAASVEASEPPPPVQSHAPPGSGAEQGAASSMGSTFEALSSIVKLPSVQDDHEIHSGQSNAAEGASQPPPPPVQSHAPSGSGASPVDREPAHVQYEELQIGAELKAANVWASELMSPVQSSAPSGSGSSPVYVDQDPAHVDEMVRDLTGPILMAPASQGSDEASRDLARMIALGGHDPSVVEDDYFKSFVRRLAPRFVVPSRHAIEGMCDSVFDEAKEDFVSRLWDTDAELSFSVATAKTIEAGQVLYLACHFIDNQWNLHRVVTDAYVVVPSPNYYGPLLGARAVRMGSDDDCYEELAQKMDGISRENGLFMSAYGTSTLRDDFARHYGNTEYDATCTDNVFCSIAQCFSSYLDSENMSAGFHIYADVRPLHLTRQKRQKLLSDRGLEHVWAHDEQWYSWYCLLEVLHNEASSTSTVTDPEIRQVLLKIWGEIFRAIQSTSASRSPTSNLYLIELFKVREVLYSEEAAQVKELADCLTKARETLDNAIKDSYSYQLWSIPLVLDPRYKLEKIKSLFEKSFGSEATKYISEVERNIQIMYDPYDDSDAVTDLDRYLTDTLTPWEEGFDVLKWWKEYGSGEYPRLAFMAKAALAAPTCTKLSSEQTAQLSSILRGYSKEPQNKGSTDMQ